VDSERKPWWLYLNLMGLDAPLVAVTWLFLFAQTWRVNYHPLEVYVTLALMVWTVRIVAKMIEGAMLAREDGFATRHRVTLRRVALVTGMLAVVLTVIYFPLSVYNYLLLGAVLVLGYFALALFSSSEDNEVSYAKHVVGGVAFAYGTALMAHVYLPTLGIYEMLVSREFLCLAVLCLLASSATDLWTHAANVEDREVKAADELALSLPLTLLGAASLVFAVQADGMGSRPFFYAILTGAALLQVLNRTRGRFQISTLKVLASLCLLIPGLVFRSYPM
jgi:hypothetical protein